MSLICSSHTQLTLNSHFGATHSTHSHNTHAQFTLNFHTRLNAHSSHVQLTLNSRSADAQPILTPSSRPPHLWLSGRTRTATLTCAILELALMGPTSAAAAAAAAVAAALVAGAAAALDYFCLPQGTEDRLRRSGCPDGPMLTQVAEV